MKRKLKEYITLGASFASVLSLGLYLIGRYYGIPEIKDTLGEVKVKVVTQGEAIARIEGKLENVTATKQQRKEQDTTHANQEQYANDNASPARSPKSGNNMLLYRLQ